MTTVSELETLILTGDVRIDSLADSVSPWNFLAPYRNTLYFTFDASNGSYIDDETNSQVFEFNANQKNAARTILSYASNLTGVNFVEVDNFNAADIHFAATNLQGSNVAGLSGITYGYSHFNGNIDTLNAESTIWLDNVEFSQWTNTPTAGTQGYEILLHEIGHMLGLGHPFDSPNALPSNLDNTNNTVMSYTSAGSPKSTFQQYDLWALTWIYGGDGLGGNWGYNSINGVSLEPSDDNIAPTVLTFSPVDGSINVDIDTTIQLTFSEAIARGTGNITLKTAAGQTIQVFNAATSSALNISGNTLTVTPASPLAGGTEYKLELPSGTIRDLAGNSFKGATTYNFTTEITQDTFAPFLDGVSPFDGSTTVAVNTDITLSFNENIAAGTGTIILRTAGGIDVASWNMASSTNLIISADNLTLELDQNLASGTKYVLHIPAGAIKDLAGNGYGGTAAYDFTTAAASDTTPPSASQFSPADDALNVRINTAITVTFTENILPGSASIVLQTATGTVIETFDPATSTRLVFAGNQLTLSPSATLASDTAYSLVFAAGAINDQAGNASAAITQYGFTTAPASQGDNNPPEGLPFIYGNALPGDILLAETKAITDSDGLGGFSYQWLRDGEAIVGANANTYAVQTGDANKAIAVLVEYVDDAGHAETLLSDARLPTIPLNDAFTDLIEMYVIILGRAPDQGGLEFWSGLIDNGLSFEDVAEEMWNSPGARAEYPPELSDEEKVETVYRNVLARDPDEDGLQFWLEHWHNEDFGPVGTMLAIINALTANNSSDPQAIQDKILFAAKVDIGGYLAISVGNDDVELAAAAFDYLEAGQSIEDTRSYIDSEVAIIGQPRLIFIDDFSA